MSREIRDYQKNTKVGDIIKIDSEDRIITEIKESENRKVAHSRNLIEYKLSATEQQYCIENQKAINVITSILDEANVDYNYNNLFDGIDGAISNTIISLMLKGNYYSVIMCIVGIVNNKTGLNYRVKVESNSIYIENNQEDFDKEKIINSQIEELYREFISIDKTEKTTIRREKVLEQIKILEDMKLKYSNNINITTGSINYYIDKIKHYGGICCGIKKNKLNEIDIIIECNEAFIDNIEKYLPEVYVVGCKCNYTILLEDESNVTKFYKLKNDGIINNFIFGRRCDNTYAYVNFTV